MKILCIVLIINTIFIKTTNNLRVILPIRRPQKPYKKLHKLEDILKNKKNGDDNKTMKYI
jgi:hypothetical protein